MKSETLINSSCRRMPASSALKTLDPGMRRDDDKIITQGILKTLVAVLTLCLLLGASLAQAGVTLESFKFDSKAEEQHFKDLIEELRCLVCQNQSLVDSDAELAHDLRAEVYDMVQAGKNDQEIVEFLVARYGDFVLYNPPIKPSTYLIWFGPFVLLLIAGLLLLRSIRRQQKVPAAEISAEERERLNTILGNTTTSQDKDQ
ncbi:MAG: cytochrome c-type biogenesis protein [Pseudomonadota bacterium]